MPGRMFLSRGTGLSSTNSVTTTTTVKASSPATTATPLTLPTLDDPIVMKMRPNIKPIASIIVDPSLATPGSVASIPEACELAQQKQQLALALANKTAVDPTMRVDIGLVKGDHQQPTAVQADDTGRVNAQEIPSYTAFYALDPTKGATVYRWGIGPSGGGCHYWEGIDIISPDTKAFEPKYPIHLADFETNIFTRCTLRSDNSAAGGGGTAIGTDGYDGGSSILHDVVMPTGGTNQHGGELTVPSTIVYSKVVAPQAAIGWNARNDTCADEVWIVDCNTRDGYFVTGAKTNAHVSASSVGSASHTAFDTSQTVTGVTDNRTDWPIPVGGLTAYTRAKYGL